MPPDTVLLRAEATVMGETVHAEMWVSALAYDADAQLRETVHRAVRHQLIDAILARWTPVVHVQR